MRVSFFILTISISALFTGCATNPPGTAHGHSFHTPPDKWTEPRIFHTRSENHLEERFHVSNVPYDGRVLGPYLIFDVETE